MMVSLWFALLLVLSTIDYRIPVGGLSLSVVEPIAVIGSLLILGQKLRLRESLYLKNPLLIAFVAITAWALIIRPFSPDWKHGLSDIRDWAVPTLTLVALLNVPRSRPQQWLAIFAMVVLGLSAFGILQHFVDGLRPFVKESADYKNVIIPDADGDLARASYAVGFFSSANSLGLFLTMGIPVVFAWLQTTGQQYGRKRYLLLLIPLVALYYTYSRFSILVVAATAVILLFHYLIPSPRRFAQALIAVVVAGGVGMAAAIAVLPYPILRTFWWRVALWDIGQVTIQQRPLTALLGNGMDYFAALSFHFQPHNLYLYMLLEYGAIGFALLLLLIGWLVWQGLQWRTQGAFRQLPALAPLWLALLSQFAIGFLETTWLTLNVREMFVLGAALFLLLAPATVPLRFPTRRVVVPSTPVQPTPYAS